MCQLNADSIPLSVRDIVALGRYAYADSQTDTQNDSIYYALSVCGISHLADEPYDKLSGGQQQKVMLARAVCQNKDIMLLDEPTSALDIVAKKQIMSALSYLSKHNKSLVFLSSHDIDLVKLYADEILYFKDNHIFDIAPSDLTENLIYDIFS
jgi:iron complex transport system ATP-binding protein